MTLVNPDSIAMIPWGPAVAALLISWLALGGAGVGQLVRRLGQWRVGLRWYGAAFGIPLAAWALAAVVAMLVFDGQLVATLTPVDLLIFPVSFLTTTVIKGPLTEEIGWRGFALPRMLQSQRPLQASLILGLIWFTWHLPLLLTDPTRPLLPRSVRRGFLRDPDLALSSHGRQPSDRGAFHGAVNTIASFVYRCSRRTINSRCGGSSSQP